MLVQMLFKLVNNGLDIKDAVWPFEEVVWVDVSITLYACIMSPLLVWYNVVE